MRRLALPLALSSVLLSPACSRALKREEAESLLRAAYPVTVMVRVPESVSGMPGSPEIVRAEAFARNLTGTGWFDIERKEDRGRVHFRFTPKAGTPGAAHPAGRGFELPAAQAVFVKALRKTDQSGGAKVTYQVKLANPTGQWPLYQLMKPNVRLGDTKDRHAEFRKDGHQWLLDRTDETLHKED
ncbi:MAG TPA: hypothetical protein VJ483_00120 [Holophagaceae bacterium]|nr:hypothetical protein [Holophagaceae bacterium]